jgi:hypothetical protein
LPQYRALVVLASRGPQNAGPLADALGVHVSTLTPTLRSDRQEGLDRTTRVINQPSGGRALPDHPRTSAREVRDRATSTGDCRDRRPCSAIEPSPGKRSSVRSPVDRARWSCSRARTSISSRSTNGGTRCACARCRHETIAASRRSALVARRDSKDHRSTSAPTSARRSSDRSTGPSSGRTVAFCSSRAPRRGCRARRRSRRRCTPRHPGGRGSARLAAPVRGAKRFAATYATILRVVACGLSIACVFGLGELVTPGALLGRAVGKMSATSTRVSFSSSASRHFSGPRTASVFFVAESTGRPGFIVPGLLAAVSARAHDGTVVGDGVPARRQRVITSARPASWQLVPTRTARPAVRGTTRPPRGGRWSRC